ncbi:MAG: EamA family transporter [Gemmatimonadales bacterium]|nr:EamA family transporter [Gemmatimonadales bacterium]MYG18483.1 EamA family transporter [Gemmatimonadales bacterium]MYH09831.1 EamA family transporter [Gemmatimonadales bacterium]
MTNSKSVGPPRRRPRDLTVDLGLMATAIIWGINFSVVKVVLREFEPLAFNALRFPFAALAVWFLLRATGRPVLPPRSEWVRILGLGVVGHVIFQATFIYGIDLTLTGNAALLLSTSPVWVLLIASALGRERFSPAILLGVVATLAGMAILITGGTQEVGGAGLGDLLVLGAALSWASFTVFGRRITKRRGALEVTGWTLWAALPVIVGMGIPDLMSVDWGSVPPGIWFATAYTGVFGIAIAYLLWSRGMKTIGQSRTAVYQNLVPVIALATAWMWLEETPTVQQLAGAAVILSGIAVARGLAGRGRRRAP